MSDPSSIAVGRIDIHGHLLPAVDDGCMDVKQSLACIRRLMSLGYVGSICTPHIWPEAFPQNTPQHIEGWTGQLANQLREAGIDYHLWPGGELRIFDGAIDWMKQHGVPTLARSRMVLTDFWVDSSPKWVATTYQWLRANRYQPILAHPERLDPRIVERDVLPLIDMGVWLQGNFLSFTGEDGYDADQQIRRMLTNGQYHFLAMDVHRPDSIEGRLDGFQLMREEFGEEELDHLTIQAPRRHVFGICD